MPNKITTTIRLNRRGTYSVYDIRPDDFKLMLHAFAMGADGKLDIGQNRNSAAYKRLRQVFLKGNALREPGAVDERGNERGPIKRPRAELAEVIDLWPEASTISTTEGDEQ